MAVPASLADVDLATVPESLGAAFAQPFLTRGRLLGRSTVGGRETIRKPPRQVFELKTQVAVALEQPLDALLGQVPIHHDRQDRVRQERDGEKTEARDEE